MDGFCADRALGSSGSAKRRRERRLRAMLRHERQTVAMALAEKLHHSSRGQKTARAGREARDALHGHVPEAPLPQGRVLRHVVGHLSVPALDVPVPQMVVQFLAAQLLVVPEPVIDPVVFVVQVYGLFWEMTSGMFPYLLGSTVDSYSAFLSLRVLLEEFHIFYVKDVPEVDSRPGAVRTGNLDIISTSSSYDVADGFFAAFCGIFRTPSGWT